MNAMPHFPLIRVGDPIHHENLTISRSSRPARAPMKSSTCCPTKPWHRHRDRRGDQRVGLGADAPGHQSRRSPGPLPRRRRAAGREAEPGSQHVGLDRRQDQDDHPGELCEKGGGDSDPTGSPPAGITRRPSSPAAQAVGLRVAARGHGHRSDQGAVWTEVDRQMQSLKSSSETHAMSDTYEQPIATDSRSSGRTWSYAEGATGLAVAIGIDHRRASTSSTSRPPAARSGTACFPGSSWMPSREDGSARSTRHRPRWMHH